MLEDIQLSVDFLKSKVAAPEIGIVLGTGLGNFADLIDVETTVPYSEIPNFPQSTVEGHKGQLVYGTFAGRKVLAMQGRFHYYEGYGMDEVVFPIRVMKGLGIDHLILSNASGGVNPDFEVGDIMLITDHINLFPANPLTGKNLDDLGPRFPDMSQPYSKRLNEKVIAAAKTLNLRLMQGVYAGVPGPNFETPAEYRMIRIIGADAVGMSTVPENIAARHMGMEVLALSVISDLGIEGQVVEVSHEEVQKAAAEAEPKLAAIMEQIVPQI